MDIRPMILIVDDVELNRAFLNDMLEDEYRILEAADGKQAVDCLEKYGSEIDVVLLDVVMPVMDGFQVLEVMNGRGWIRDIPVIMISAETSSAYTNKGFEMGVTDYISRPFDFCTIRHRIKNTIMLYARQRALQGTLREQIREKERNNTLMVDILSTIVEFRNGESGLHVLRIRVITEILLEELASRFPQYGLTQKEIVSISNAAALHDIGKAAIDEQILNKPGRLTAEEYEKMKEHTVLGAGMLEKMMYGREETLVRYARDICRWHHERWDGGGYPDGLSGEKIPLCAQVVSLADVYDALVSERVYKPAYSHEKAMEMIRLGECGQFNPRLLDCLQAVAEMLEERIREKSSDDRLLFDVEEISREILKKKEDPEPSERTMYLLERERVKYQFLAALSNEILFEYDAQEDVLTFSERGHTELGLEPLYARAGRDREQIPVLSGEDIADLWEHIFSTTPDQPFFKKQYRVIRPDGERIWYEFIVRSLWSSGAAQSYEGFIGKMSNIHAQKVETARLREMAERDSMTRLYNRAAARRLIHESLEDYPEQKAAMLFFDMDSFKQVNDTYGHAFGDELLKFVASTVCANIREDDIAARLGGDEFIIFLKNIHGRQDAKLKAGVLCSVLSGNFQGHVFSASIGCAMYPEDGTDYETLLHRADLALYKAKGEGKSRYAFFSPQDEEASQGTAAG